MIQYGKYNRLKVVSKDKEGIYLEGNDTIGDILLPIKHVPKGLQIHDEVDVFVYFDTKDQIIATTQTPYAIVGQFATLKVASIEEFGVFLDWGLDKDLFVPFREQLFEMRQGQSYVVYVYVDSSDRIAASTRISKFIDKSPAPFSEGETVDLLLFQETELGIKAIINGSHEGLIYKDDIINDLKLGDQKTGFIKRLRPDNKIDLGLPSQSNLTREQLAKQILEKLEANGGSLSITAKSPASEINGLFNVSRKKFKVALGFLYKNKKISVSETEITVVKK